MSHGAFPFPRELDPVLYDICAEGLVEPGWTGELADEELAWLKDKLHRSPALRRRWGLRKRFTKAELRRVAREGLADDET